MEKILSYSIETVIQSNVTVPSISGGTYSGRFYGHTPQYYLTTPYTPDFDLSATDFYISADFNLNTFTMPPFGQVLVSKDTYGSNFDWALLITDANTITVYSNATTTNLTITVPTMNTGQWYNVKFERSGGVNTLYLDGVAYGSNTMGISNASQFFVTVGCSSWNNPSFTPVDGYIDNVIIYNANTGSNVLDLDFENLDASKQFFTDNTGKILTIHPTPFPRFIVDYNDIVKNGLIVHYDMVNINSYDRTGTTVNDLTGNGHTGTLAGGTSFTLDGGISFNGIYGKLTYLLDIPSAMTHVIVAKSNQPTWSDYNGLGCYRGPNGWSTHPWQGTSTDISMGVNDNAGGGIGNFVSIAGFNPQNLHVYCVTTDGTNCTSYVDLTEYPVAGTVTRDNTTTGATIRIANDDVPYDSRFTDVTVYAHLIYNRSLTKAEVIKNYNAFKNYA